MRRDANGVRLRLPKYCEGWIDRLGRPRHYFRRHKKDPRITLHGLPWSPGFMAAYEIALTGRPLPLPPLNTDPALAPAANQMTLNEALALYYASTNFLTDLSLETGKYRRRCLTRFASEGSEPPRGERPLKALTRAALTKILDEYESRHSAQSAKKALKHFYGFCILRGYADEDPTAEMTVRPPAASEGFYTWTEADAATFVKHYPLGTRANVMFAIMSNLGLRRADFLRFGPEHIVNGRVRMLIQKTRRKTLFKLDIALSALPELKAALAAYKLPPGQKTFVAHKQKGTALAAGTVSGWMREMCDKIELPDCSAHGLRKLCAVRLAQAGCSAKQIQSITGHANLKVLEEYIRKVNQGELADDAADRLAAHKVRKGRAAMRLIKGGRAA